MKPSTENIAYAQFLAKTMGINPKVFPYYDNDKINSVDILSIDDPLNAEIAFYSTIGLSDFPNKIALNDNSMLNIPIELLMCGYKKYDKIGNILATASFYISKNQWTCQPATVFKDIVSDYYVSQMQHIMFIRPFLWEEKLSDLKFGKKPIHCLLCIPISDEELRFKEENGLTSLEKMLFEKKNIDIFDIERESVL
ncbi:suppressor of fused domain protein [Capnocytophaga canimorsus]|uniref:suppressor of fused domain protein n=1 Tax=Capnocytophaga canimorsus TaxID=28188 RepID=UPI00156274CE|nr:suppressor of fused domain protein [Capnocytophaga canimorsus]GIM59501.1 antitoxin YqcF [Capnocytophaga canimorsus]